MNYPFRSPDRTRPLVPERLPWLAHTSFWSSFDDRERLRANQLMGLLVNELCLLVEHGLILNGLAQACRAAPIRENTAVSRRMRAMLSDERRHACWFKHYNRSFAPEIYDATGMRFIDPPTYLRRTARLFSAIPGVWRITSWLVLATEEWSCRLAEAVTGTNRESSDCDPAFRQLHAAHRRDELRHVNLDQDVLSVAARGIPPAVRRLVVAAAHAGLAQIMRPRRAAPAMVRQFVKEFPRWNKDLPQMVREVRAVGARTDYWRDQGVQGRLTATERCAAQWGLAWPEALNG